MTEITPISFSASVIPVRQAGDNFEIFLLKRAAKSSFMPGRYVFPGGKVEDSDGMSDRTDTRFRVAAIRELWEEAGVILANEDINRVDAKLVESLRSEVDTGAKSLDEAMNQLELTPDLNSLIPYARWITPLERPKRFDNIFYLTRMPDGQTPKADNKETSEGIWLTPEKALKNNESGESLLAAPQVRIVGELSVLSYDDLFTPRSTDDLEPVIPRMIINDNGRMILFPWDGDYNNSSAILNDSPCKAFEASRVVSVDGKWLPHKSV